MQNNKSSIHQIYSKTNHSISQTIKENPTNTHPVSVHTHPIFIHPPDHYPQFFHQRASVPNSPKKIINTSHYVIGEAVGYTHCNVLPPKFKPFQPSASDIYTKTENTSYNQSQYMRINKPFASANKSFKDEELIHNTKSSPVIEVIGNIHLNRSLQTLLNCNTNENEDKIKNNKKSETNTNTDTLKRKHIGYNDLDQDKQKRIQNFFNESFLIDCDEKVRNIIKQHTQFLGSTDEDRLDKIYEQNMSQAGKSFEQMKQILQKLINTKQQKINKKQNAFNRRKKITNKIESILKTKRE